jgi:PIN domain
VSFLLNTNVVSEWVKPRPDPSVVAWLAAVDEDQVFISVVTLAELRYGIGRALAVGELLAVHDDVLRVEPWPDDVYVPSFGRRMACTRCGIVDADARPNWKERAVRPNRTGRAAVKIKCWRPRSTPFSVPMGLLIGYQG